MDVFLHRLAYRQLIRQERREHIIAKGAPVNLTRNVDTYYENFNFNYLRLKVRFQKNKIIYSFSRLFLIHLKFKIPNYIGIFSLKL